MQEVELAQLVLCVLVSAWMQNSNINTAISTAFLAVQNSTAPGALNVTPFKDVGPWFKAAVYYDTNGNDG